MKRPLLFVVFIVAVAVFSASCGGDDTTTSSVAPITTASTPSTGGAETSTTVTPTTGSTPSSEVTTSSSMVGQPGQLVVQLTGESMVPPVQTTNTATLTVSLQGASIVYELTAQGLQPSDVTSAGIYVNTGTTPGATGSTDTAGAGGQQGEMVIDLLAGQDQSSTTTSGVGTGTVIASGTLNQQNVVGSMAGRSVPEIIALLGTVGEGDSVWAQINTQTNPNGELRGYIQLGDLIRQMLGGGATTPGT